MLLTLALFAQTAALPADTREAALTCSAAIRASTAPVTNEMTVRGTYFMMTAARMGKAPPNLLERTLALREEVEKRSAALKGKGEALMPECRKRFPTAWKTSGVALPSDRYDRLMLCFSATTFLDGLYDSGSSTAEKDRTASLSQRFEGLISPELDTRGVTTTEAVVDAMVGALDKTLDLGNLAGVVNACETAFPG